MYTILSEKINPKLFPSLIKLNLAPFCLVLIISWQNFDRMLTKLVFAAVSSVLLQPQTHSHFQYYWFRNKNFLPQVANSGF